MSARDAAVAALRARRWELAIVVAVCVTAVLLAPHAPRAAAGWLAGFWVAEAVTRVLWQDLARQAVGLLDDQEDSWGSPR